MTRTPDDKATIVAQADGDSPKGRSSRFSWNEKMVDPDGILTHTDIRRNMVMLIMLEAIFAVGAADLSVALAPLWTYLGASNKIIGLVNAPVWAGLTGFILSPYITRRFRYKKYYFFVTSILVTVWVLLLGVGLALAPGLGISKPSLLIFAAGCVLLYYFVAGFVALPHQEYTAGCIPMNYRGTMFGASITVSSVLSIAALALGRYFLMSYEAPLSYSYLLLLVWLIWFCGYLFAIFAREKPAPIEKSAKPWSREMFRNFWLDKPFIRYLVVWMLAVATIVQVWNFIPIYAIKVLKLGDAVSADIALVQKVVAIGVTFFTGILVDKVGPKRVFPYATLAVGIGYALVFFVPSKIGVYASSAIVSLAFAPFYSCATVLGYSIPKPEHRAGHYSIQFLLTGVFFLAGSFSRARWRWER